MWSEVHLSTPALSAVMSMKNPDIFTFIEKIKFIQTETERTVVQNIRIRVNKKNSSITKKLIDLKKLLNEAAYIEDECLIKHCAACGFTIMSL